MTVADVVNWLRRHKRLNIRDATAVTLALVQWTIASDRVGHFASIADFVKWSGEGQRTVERRSSRIRRVLNEDEFRWLVDELRRGDADESVAGVRAAS